MRLKLYYILMLDVNTLPKRYRKVEEFDFDAHRVKCRSKRIGRREKLLIQNKCALVPKIAVVRKEEGATAAASHLPSFTAG